MKIFKITLLALSLIVIGALALSCTPQANSAPISDQQTFKVERGNLRKDITPAGNIAMPRAANLTFGAAGTVQQVLVQIGDSVKQGQVLARLDANALEQALVQAKIDMKTAQMNLERAKIPTITSGIIMVAPDPLDIEIKELILERTKLRVVEAQKQLDNAMLTAPFAGLVATVPILAGDLVTSNTVAARMIDPTQLEVNALVNEMDIFQLKIGAAATVQIDAMPTIRLPATVIAISPAATVSGGVVNYPVKLQVKLSDPSKTGAPSGAQVPSPAPTQAAQKQGASPIPPLLREGLTTTVNILIEERENVLLVPSRAIIRQGKDTVVQLVKNDTIEQRSVKTGISNWQYMEVTEGLNEGDVVTIPQTQTPSSSAQSGIPGMPGSRPSTGVPRGPTIR